jgi:hypothetical protein
MQLSPKIRVKRDHTTKSGTENRRYREKPKFRQKRTQTGKYKIILIF